MPTTGQAVHRRWGLGTGPRIAALVGVLCGLAALCGAQAWADDPVIAVEANQTAVSSGGVILLTVSLEGFSRNASEPRLPETVGFDVYDAGRSTNISLINGHLTKRTTYTYQLLARKEGSYSFGPVTVEDRGKTYRSAVLTFQVHDGASPGDSRREGSAPEREQASDGEQDRGLFARIEVDDRDVFQDEQIILRFRLYQRTGIRVLDITEFQPPTTEGFWKEDLGPQREYAVTIQGEPYKVRELSWALFPTASGERVIGEGSVVCLVPAPSSRRRGGSDFFGRSLFDFDSQPVRLTTQPLRILVRPLPEEGRPPGFTGSVGEYRIWAGVDQAAPRQGEPLTLTVTVAGSGHVQTIGEPLWPAWDDFRVFDSGEAVSIDKSAGQVTGEKTFTQVLIPTRTGKVVIPPISFDYFDPAAGRYRQVATAPLTIQVGAAAARTGDSSRRDIVSLGEDILYIRTRLAETLRSPGTGPLAGGLWLHLLPLGVILAGAVLRRRRRILEDDPVLARRSRALPMATKRLKAQAGSGVEGAAGLAQVVEEYLGDWLDVEVRGLRRLDLEQMLDEAGVAPEQRAALLSLLDWVDEVRFGAGDPARRPDHQKRLEGLLPEVEKQLRAAHRRPGRARV